MICLVLRWLLLGVFCAVLTTSCRHRGEQNQVRSNEWEGGGSEGLVIPSVLSDHMVIQRQLPIRIWGKGIPDADVCVRIEKDGSEEEIRRRCNKVKKDGYFLIDLEPLEASLKPHTITIASGAVKKTIHDVLIGEVWLTSGQSNMELQVQYSLDKEEAYGSVGKLPIRIFYQEKISQEMEQNTSPVPLFDTAGGNWKAASSRENISETSAVGYFFALALHQKYKERGEEIPVAILNSAVGSSGIYTWMSREKLVSHFNFSPGLDRDWRKNGSFKGEPAYLQPTACFNHKIMPLRFFTIRGVLWIQGEGNSGGATKAKEYSKALSLFIKDWREKWGSPQMPFILAQAHPSALPYESKENLDDLAYVREAQIDGSLDQPQTCVVPIHDLDLTWNWGSFDHKHPLHPLGKKQVGERMAWAFSKLREGDGEGCSGPIFRSMEQDGHRMLLNFSHVGSGLKVRTLGERIKGFAVAGEDRRFMAAEAKIIASDKIVVWHPKIAQPVAVTYGFTGMNQAANVVGGEGIPLSPFRSDRIPSDYVRIRPKLYHEGELMNLTQINPVGGDLYVRDGRASRGGYRLFRGADSQGSLTFDVPVPEDAYYRIHLRAMRGPGFGISDVYVDNLILKSKLDFYERTEGIHSFLLSERQFLKKGHHGIRMVVTGKNSKASAAGMGIDLIEMVPLGPEDESIVDE